MKNIIKKSIYVTSLVLIFSGIISCEKDFTDIGTSIIRNNVFTTDNILVDLKLENKEVESFRSDNISLEAGQYLLGIYNSADYEKLEASILSQIGISTILKYTDETFDTGDTTVISTIDTVFLKIPYQATLLEITATGPRFKLDSIIGDQNEAFTLNLFQSDEYLNRLNPQDPTKVNEYFSNIPFQKMGSELNSEIDYQFKPNKNDTVIVVKRWLSNGLMYDKDTIKISASGNEIPLPFARIAIDEVKFKTLLFDKYESSEFSSQDAFNNYFRGLILEATGNDGSLISFNFNNTNPLLNPSIEVYYTNTVVKGGITILDTIKKTNSFNLSGLRRGVYKMEDRTYPVNEQVKIQGTGGSEVTMSLFGADSNNSGMPDQLEELRSQNLLVNDALLTVYIDQQADTTALPVRLYLYKDGVSPNGAPALAHIKDIFTESITFGGFVETENGKKAKYNFRITDYISDLLSGAIDYNPKLTLKAHNQSDFILNDTVYRAFSWTPKAVTLLNEAAGNGVKRPELKVSYSKKEN